MQRLAHGNFLPATAPCQIAHHQTSSDPDPYLQPRPRNGRRQTVDRLDDGKAGAHCPFRGILLRLGIAEIGEHPITKTPDDVATQPDDRRCAALLVGADNLADILRIQRPGRDDEAGRRHDVMGRGRRTLVLDLRDPAAVASVLALVERADILIEGYRPGVMERLGLGPDVCLQRNPRLVFGRMTGWGQTGPLSHAAGHDINYIALSGALNAIGDVPTAIR